MNSKKEKIFFLVLLLNFLIILPLSFDIAPSTHAKYTKKVTKTINLNVVSDMASIKITSNPTDADIYIKVNGGSEQKVSSGYTAFYNKGTIISYTIKKKYYYDEVGSITVTTPQDYNFTLTPDPRRDLSVIPNVNGLIAHCLVNGETLFYTTDYSQSKGIVNLGDDVECSAGAGSTYYATKDDSTKTYYPWYTHFTVEGDNAFTPELSKIPGIGGTYINTNNTTSANDFLKNYYPGYYLIELWGGKGGDGSSKGSASSGTAGAAGYVYGVIYLNREEEITYMLGGNGTTNTAGKITSVKNLAGGANGGGNASIDDNYLYVGGAGGGWSTVNKKVDNSIIMLAGGGGGAAGPGGSSGGQKGGNGGNGGSISNINTDYIASYGTGTMFFGLDGGCGEKGCSVNSHSIVAHGGTTVAGYNEAYPEKTKYQVYAADMQAGSLYGGKSIGRGGGGGAGIFGGAGGFSEAADSYSGVAGHARTSGGGGGSSFIEGYVEYQNLPEKVTKYLVKNNPSSTGGAIIITYIGDTLS